MTALSSVELLFQSQFPLWDMMRENYEKLKDVKVKTVSYGDFNIKVQYNPRRIISSSAKTDDKSINERPCFLCADNRPVQQKGISYQNKTIILINPYPVFHRHLTIPTIRHIPQRIKGNLPAMLQLAFDLPGYTIIYNGPKCGASAPDHFHFQAIPQGILPIEKDFELKTKIIQMSGKDPAIYTWNNYLRNPVTFSASDPGCLEESIHQFLCGLQIYHSSDDEPMINMLAQYSGDRWIVHLFPRKAHRPRQYFDTDEKRLLLSPASIDMGGILILPRENDFNRITQTEITDIMDQVCEDNSIVQSLVKKMIHHDK